MHLTPEAQQSLDALAATAVTIDAPHPDAETIAHSLVDLTTQSHTLQQQLARLDYLHAYLQSHLSNLRAQLRDVQPSKDGSSGFVFSRDLPQQTQEWTRNTKLLKGKFADYEDRLAGLDAKAAVTQAPDFEEVVRLEKELRDIRARLTSTQRQVEAYEGLPPNKDAARQKVKNLENKVEGLRTERDTIFAAIVNS